MNPIDIAIIGATGMVGRQMILELDLYQVPVRNLYLFASDRSEGMIFPFRGKEIVVQALNTESLNTKIDVALFSAGGNISKLYAPLFAKHGVIVIDNSSYFRMQPNVPLVVPEINSNQIRTHQNIISNPNCSTIIALLPIYPIHQRYGIKHIVYSTYQAVSGSGNKGVFDLNLELQGNKPIYYPKPILHNVIPWIDDLVEHGNTKEEEKMIFETKKILNDQSIKVSSTCVRVPVFNGHSVSVYLECEKEIDFDQIKRDLKNQKGVVLIEQNQLLTPLEVSGSDQVYVVRLRKDLEVKNAIQFFAIGDNIRKGAAANAVQICLKLMEEKHETI